MLLCPWAAAAAAAALLVGACTGELLQLLLALLLLLLACLSEGACSHDQDKFNTPRVSSQHLNAARLRRHRQQSAWQLFAVEVMLSLSKQPAFCFSTNLIVA